MNNYMSEMDLSKRFCEKCGVEIVNDTPPFNLPKEQWKKMKYCLKCQFGLEDDAEILAEIEMATGECELRMMEEEDDN